MRPQEIENFSKNFDPNEETNFLYNNVGLTENDTIFLLQKYVKLTKEFAWEYAGKSGIDDETMQLIYEHFLKVIEHIKRLYEERIRCLTILITQENEDVNKNYEYLNLKLLKVDIDNIENEWTSPTEDNENENEDEYEDENEEKEYEYEDENDYN